MTNVPRRLPPTQGQRLRNVTVTHASLSGQGRTAAARPVSQSRPAAQIYQPPTTGGGANVVTGTADPTSVAVTSTTAGDGNTTAAGVYSVAMVDGATASGQASVGIGKDARATGRYSTVVGGGASTASGQGALASGFGAVASGLNAVAVGSGTEASGNHSTAVGDAATAAAAGAVAIGADHTGNYADAENQDEFILGTALHKVIVRGLLVLRDASTGSLYKLTVSGGSLSVTAYP